MMRKVTIQVEAIETGLERFTIAWKTGKRQREFIAFETIEEMLKTLTANRWVLLRVLQAEGPMSVRVLARQVRRDIKNVHTDVVVLKAVGLVEDHEQGIWVPYTEIEAYLRLAA